MSKSVKRILVLTLLLTASSAAFGQSPRGGNAEQEIISLHRDFQDAMVKRDVQALGRLLADDYTGTDVVAGTKQTKATIIETFKANPLPTGAAGTSESVETGSPAVSVYGDTAVLTSRSVHKGQDPAGKAFAVPVLQTSVFARQGGRWRVVATHGCRIDQLQSEAGAAPAQARAGGSL
jgi:ketosteroid isomerase-like protein